MLEIFLFVLFSVGLPAGVVFFLPRFRGKSFFYFPLFILLNVFWLAVLASLGRNDAYGPLKTGLFIVLAPLFTFMCLRQIQIKREANSVWRGRTLLFLSFLALIAILDNFYISGVQGWSFQQGSLFSHAVSYFRGPFNTDAERNVIVVNSLIRGGMSPFLPHSHYAFQLFWFYFAALFVSLFHGITNYPFVAGCTLATSYLFFFAFFWSLLIFRPTLGKRKLLAGALFILFVTHADIYHGILSLWQTGQMGMEADGSFHWTFFRNFSLKLMTLVSPHHTLFFAFFCLFLILRKIVGRGSHFFSENLFFTAGFLTSPVMGLIVGIPMLGLEFMTGRSPLRATLKKFLFFLVTAFCAHWFVLGISPTIVIFRDATRDFNFFPYVPWEEVGRKGWLELPTLWVASEGMIGLLVLALLIREFVRRKITNSFALFLGLGGIFVYYLVSAIELQRHFAIVASFLAGFYLVSSLPLFKAKWERVVVMVSFFALLMHPYFIYCFTGKPNIVDPKIAWKDYFEMNEQIQKNFPGVSVMAARAHRNGGFPIVQEVTTSYSAALDAMIYNQLGNDQRQIFFKILAEGHVVPYAKELGYETILWGPVEQKVWGERVRNRFIIPGNLLLVSGTVRLYRLEDRIEDYFPVSEKSVAGAYIRRGDALMEAQWNQEAFEAYSKALELEPKNARVANNIGQLFLSGGQAAAAAPYFLKAIQNDPKRAEAHHNLAVAWTQLGLTQQAEQEDRAALSLNPRLSLSSKRK